MSSKIIIHKFVLLILSILVSHFAEAQMLKKYPYKTGKVEYQTTGSAQGKQILYWDEYGNKEFYLDIIASNIDGIRDSIKLSRLSVNAEQYEWSDEDESVYQVLNPVAETWINGGFSAKNMKAFQKQLIAEQGYEKIGTGVFLGRQCEIYKGLATVWVWQGIQLKLIADALDGQITRTATDVSIGLSFPISFFELPEDKVVVRKNDAELLNNEQAPDLNPIEIEKALKELFDDYH